MEEARTNLGREMRQLEAQMGTMQKINTKINFLLDNVVDIHRSLTAIQNNPEIYIRVGGVTSKKTLENKRKRL